MLTPLVGVSIIETMKSTLTNLFCNPEFMAGARLSARTAALGAAFINPGHFSLEI
jgi:hypothetical protein